MYREKQCAKSIRMLEGEDFLAIGEQVALFLDPHFQKERLRGLRPKFPDLISVKQERQVTFARIREIKFKLEQRLILKALKQLKTGLEYFRVYNPLATIDRVEYVVALQGRSLKKEELSFIGEPMGARRYLLMLNDLPLFIVREEKTYPVTLLVL